MLSFEAETEAGRTRAAVQANGKVAILAATIMIVIFGLAFTIWLLK